eukprot:TRINITY_DN2749_c0_g1_i1.p1 TRINITY_DN2749_c0_g1~~TRINITY_DN2749_c0_g1_i1.p1  ORF type:complete len:208 (-),score=73.10 TRINITY_DN2749_c0_g1_i1:175-798(-)
MMSEEIDHSESTGGCGAPATPEEKCANKLSSSAGDILIQESLRELSLPLDSKKRTPKRSIHFSDGVIEEYSSSSEDEDPSEGRTPVSPSKDSSAGVAQNPKDMSWMPWVMYYVSFSGCSTLRVAESLGEKLGWFFGITSPKYFYEIQEFKRAKKEAEDQRTKEAASKWNTGSGDKQTVITLDPKKLPSNEFMELSLSHPRDESLPAA